MRAHFNMLGIPASDTLGLERYLMETYLFAIDLFVHVILLATVFIVAYGIISIAWRTIIYLSPEVPGKVVPRLANVLLSRFVAWIALIASIGGTLGLLAQAGDRTDLVVGSLVRSELSPPATWPFLLALLVVSAGLITCFLRQDKTSSSNPVWKLVTLSLLGWILLLPILYGQVQRPHSYPRVLVEHAGINGDQKFCGLLVLTTALDYRVWHTEHQGGQVIGIVTVLPRSSVNQVLSGKVESIFKFAQSATERNKPTPCTVGKILSGLSTQPPVNLS